MGRALRIAVADDEPLIRRWLAETLPELGHSVVVEAATGKELVEGCRAASPDLVISDIRMPDTDGIDAALAIARWRPTPIILVSAFHDETLIDRAQEAPVLAYLVKPIQRADLETTIALADRRFEQWSALAREAQDLRQALADRKVIERAKGELMRQKALGEAEAFARLQKIAADHNWKLVEAARRVLEATQAPPATEGA